MSEAGTSRILVVEDDLHLAEGMAENMRAEGYDADTAHDGKLGLEKALAGGYDLLVLDVMLPQMDGVAVFRGQRSQLPHLPGPRLGRHHPRPHGKRSDDPEGAGGKAGRGGDA